MFSMSNNVILENDKVILVKDKSYKIVTVVKKRKEKFENCDFFLDNAIGHPYGTLFVVNQKQLEAVQNRENLEDFEKTKVEELTVDDDGVTGKDNRHLRDTSDNQGLTCSSIEQMKKDGASGQEIMSKLIENSTSFKTKTKYAQEKYLKKKKKRHIDFFTVQRPTTRLLCEMYYTLKRSKILGLRVDTVSQILAYANVHANCNVLLSETCAGLLIGAVTERQGLKTAWESPEGTGQRKGLVFHFFHGTAPVRPETLDLGEGVNSWWGDRVHEVSMAEMTSLRLTGGLRISGDSVVAREDVAETSSIVDSPCSNKIDDTMEVTDKANSNNKRPSNNGSGDAPSKRPRQVVTKQDIVERRARRFARENAACVALTTQTWDALIVATKYLPDELVLGMLHFLAPGRPFVVYGLCLQPLVDLLNVLKMHGNVGLLNIQETWLRHYQVLPERTHPVINMSGTGGYLLTGYKLE